jgi:hypothetical protein
MNKQYIAGYLNTSSENIKSWDINDNGQLVVEMDAPEGEWESEFFVEKDFDGSMVFEWPSEETAKEFFNKETIKWNAGKALFHHVGVTVYSSQEMIIIKNI